MRAVVQGAYGDPDLLQVRDDLSRPACADDGMLIRVRASSVNAGDWRRVRGTPSVLRLGEGLRRPRDGGLGVDVAGEVVATGPASVGHAVGDAVYGMVPTGAFAEYVTGGWFIPKPARLSFEQAAVVPAVGCTALQSVRDHGQVQSGDRVLVYGAGGGVGTFVVQIAKALGATVTAVTNAASLDTVASLGADRVLDYAREDALRDRAAYGVIIDMGGRVGVGRFQRALTGDGRLVLVGAGAGPGGPVRRLLGGQVRSRLLRQRVDAFLAAPAGFVENLTTLAGLIDSGAVTPVIDRVYPLEQTADAIRHLESGHARGKVVISI